MSWISRTFAVLAVLYTRLLPTRLLTTALTDSGTETWGTEACFGRRETEEYRIYGVVNYKPEEFVSHA